MLGIELTAYQGAILGPIAKVLGWIMDAIYMAIYNAFGIENLGLSIFLLTVLIYTCLLPLTYKQQKFSKLNQIMQPEISAIRSKYEGKRDQASMMAMNQETQAVYDKYGVSATGSCVQMLIQMPILFALYRVFYNIPAYVTSVKDQFSGLVDGIVNTDGFVDKLTKLMDDYSIRTTSNVTADLLSDSKGDTLNNYIVDVLYKIPSNGWDKLTDYFPDLSSQIDGTISHIEKFNYILHIGSFRGLNISDTPFSIIKYYWTEKPSMFMAYVIVALLIPVLSYVSQLLSVKLMPTADTGNDQMAQQMKTMNLMMPLMSLFIAFTVPVGLVFYWIVGAVVRIVQQYFLNKHFEKIDLESIIEKNKDKAAAKAEKRGIRQAQIYEAARMSTKSTMTDKANLVKDNDEVLKAADELRAKANSNSMAKKANLVKEFNEMNNR